MRVWEVEFLVACGFTGCGEDERNFTEKSERRVRSEVLQ